MPKGKKPRNRRAGRARQTIQREPNGRPQRAGTGEREADVISLAINRRARLVGPEKARDQRAGTALGVAHLRGWITEDQFHAGEQFGSTLLAYAGLMGFDVTGPRSPAAAMVGGSGGGGAERSDAAAVRIRQAYEAAYGAIQKLRFEPPVGEGINTGSIIRVLRKVCGRDEQIAPSQIEEIAALRKGLEVLAAFYGLTKKPANVRNTA